MEVTLVRSALFLLACTCAAELAVGCGDTSSGGATAAAGTGGSTGGGPSEITGTLGELGNAQPIVSSFVIENSGEKLLYMSSAPLDCDLLTVSRWLGSVEDGAQVVEIVIDDTFDVGTLDVGGSDGAEVNYAKGGRSSSYEESASSGTVTFTKNSPQGSVEGAFEASFIEPTAHISGRFQASFCEGGQGY